MNTGRARRRAGPRPALAQLQQPAVHRGQRAQLRRPAEGLAAGYALRQAALLHLLQVHAGRQLPQPLRVRLADRRLQPRARHARQLAWRQQPS